MKSTKISMKKKVKFYMQGLKAKADGSINNTYTRNSVEWIMYNTGSTGGSFPR